MPVVLIGKVTDFAPSMVRLKASTVLISGLGAPARTLMPRGDWPKSTSVPATIQPSAISSSSPSLDMITTSSGTPTCNCAPMVSGPTPCDAPLVTVTLMPVVFSNSG